MLVVQIVRRFVQNQNRRIFEQKLHQQNFRALTAGKVGNILIKPDVAKPQTACNFFNLGIKLIEAAVFENLLDFTGVFHHFIHFLPVFGKHHILVNLQHLRFQFVHMVEGRTKHFAYCHAFFQHRMLVEISDCHMA